MAELSIKERLQPSLLDRLTDDEPGRATELFEARTLSPARLRETVRRDLAWLFNSTHLQAVCDLGSFPLVARSVINFGIPDLAGRPVSGLNTAVLEQMVRQAILDFEPRLARSSLRVSLVVDEQQMNRNALLFDIEADLWMRPLPLRLYLRTAFDLETGKVDVNEKGKTVS